MSNNSALSLANSNVTFQLCKDRAPQRWIVEVQQTGNYQPDYIGQDQLEKVVPEVVGVLVHLQRHQLVQLQAQHHKGAEQQQSCQADGEGCQGALVDGL